MSRSRTAASTRMPAARSRCRATAARRRCRAGPSCSTSSPTARPPKRCARTRSSSRSTGRPRARAPGRRSSRWRSTTAPSSRRWRTPPASRVSTSRTSRSCASARRAKPRPAAADFGILLDGRLGQEALDDATGRWHLDRPPDRAARLDSAALRGRRRCRLHAAGMARRALRQVPGVLSPGRSRGAAGGAGGAGAPPVRCGPPDRPRAAARDHPEPLRGAGRRQHARAGAGPVLRARRLPGLVEAARSGEPGGLGCGRRHHRAPRSVLPRRAAFGPGRPAGRARGELRARRAPAGVQGLRDRPHDLRRAGARLDAAARSTTRPRRCAWPTLTPA